MPPLQRFLDQRSFGAAATAVAAIAVFLLDRLVGLLFVVFLVLGFFSGFSNEVRRVEEGALLSADVDEGCLNSGEHCIDPAQIDVTDHASVVWTIDEKLDEFLVLQNRDPRFTRDRVNEDFSFHYSPSHSSLGDSASEM